MLRVLLIVTCFICCCSGRDRRGVPVYPSGNARSGHSYNHVYGGSYNDDGYSYSQHQARSSANSAAGGSSVAPAERNGKPGGGHRYQDPAPRAWGDGRPSRSTPRYVLSPVQQPPFGPPTAPVGVDERQPPYYYLEPA